MARLLPLLSLFLLFVDHLTAAQTDKSSSCSCFLTNGSSSGYFTSHSFYDYRKIPSISSTIPPLLTDAANTTYAANTSDFFSSDEFTDMWAVQNWNNSDTRSSSDATILMVNSPNNIYIESSKDSSPDYSTYLTLRTARLPKFQTAAEIDSVAQNYLHVSLRVLARVVGSPGGCAGIFTYLPPPSSNPQDVQEADIEILTSGPRNAVQYTNQPSNDAAGNTIPQATVNATIPGGVDWTKWNTYRADWMPGKTSWYVNGQPAAEISFQAPRSPAGLIIDMWSDGGSWTGNMSLYDEAFLQIQWVEVAFNVSGPVGGAGSKRAAGLERRKSSGCSVVCGVDDNVNVTGTPVVLTGLATSWKGERKSALIWIPVIIAGLAIFGWL